MLEHIKPKRKEKIIQFGGGVFLRGFADWMLQIMNEKTDFCGDAVIVQSQRSGRSDALKAQNYVYTHVMRGLSGGVPTVEAKVVDSVSRTIKVYDEYEGFLALADNPNFCVIISNTTEAGIAYAAGDRMTDAPPSTFPARVTALLYRRYTQGLDGFVFLPCELIEKNGEMLKKIILMYARDWGLGEGFCMWVEEKNIFCNTLVDRIVTGYPADENIELGYEDSMLNTSELFHLWVIEGPRAIFDIVPLDKIGLNIILTDDLEIYRTRKVRILNGAHTAMVPYALLEGVETVGECMENERIYSFLKKCVYDEIIPTLDLSRDELLDYANDVFERFRNPYIRHKCAAISLNSVSKFKVRVLPSILEYAIRFDALPENLTLSLYKLIELYKVGTPNDAPEVIEFMRNASIDEILANTELWDRDISFLSDKVKSHGNK